MNNPIRLLLILSITILCSNTFAQKACFNLTMPYVEKMDPLADLHPSANPIEDSLFWTYYNLGQAKDGHYVIKWDTLNPKMEGNIVNGKREGIWKFYNKVDYYIAVYCVNYSKGKKNDEWFHVSINNKDTLFKEYGSYKNDRREGRFTFFDYFDGKPVMTSESNYANGYLDGKSIRYFENGKIQSIEFFSAGKNIGEHLIYEEDEKTGNTYLSKETIYGHKPGNHSEMEFNRQGDTIRMANYVDSVLNGRIINNLNRSNINYSYYKNGKIEGVAYTVENKKDTIEIENYKNGLNHGYDIVFNTKKDTLSIKHYEYGELDGKSVQYDENKQIASVCTYKEGLKDGEELQFETRRIDLFFNKRFLYSIRNYTDGVLDGLAKQWHSNGKLRYELIFKDNLPYTSISAFSEKGKKLDAGTLANGNGIFHFYYSDGEPYYTYTFINGKCKGKYHIDALKTSEDGFIFGIRDTLSQNTNYEDFSICIDAYFPYRNYTKTYKIRQYKIDSKYDTIKDLCYVTRYNSNGSKESEVTYTKTNLKSGSSKTYYENGKLNETGYYKIYVNENGRTMSDKDSLWLNYYESGAIKSEENYKQDKLFGISKYYDEVGALKRTYYVLNDSTEFSIYNSDTVNYLNHGIKQGKWIRLGGSTLAGGCNDQPIDIEYYKNGKPLGTWNYYSTVNGNLYAQYAWKDTAIAYYTKYNTNTHKLVEEGWLLNKATRFGTWKIYDYQKGYLKAEGAFDKDEYSGKWTIYKKNGTIKRLLDEKKVASYLYPKKIRFPRIRRIFKHHRRRYHGSRTKVGE